MSSDPAHSDAEEGRVIAFRPNAGSNRPTQPADGDNAVKDLAQYERPPGDDDYRHRMRVNLAALAILALLIGGGIWIADVMAQIRKNQDCVMAGRRNCAGLSVSGPQN